MSESNVLFGFTVVFLSMVGQFAICRFFEIYYVNNRIEEIRKNQIEAYEFDVKEANAKLATARADYAKYTASTK